MQCPLDCGGDDTVEGTGDDGQFRCSFCGYTFEVAEAGPLTDMIDALEDVVNDDGLASWDDVEAFAKDALDGIEVAADGAGA